MAQETLKVVQNLEQYPNNRLLKEEVRQNMVDLKRQINLFQIKNNEDEVGKYWLDKIRKQADQIKLE